MEMGLSGVGVTGGEKVTRKDTWGMGVERGQNPLHI